MANVACSRCGDFIDSSEALYSERGDLVCDGCNERAEIDVGEQRAAKGIFATAGGAFSTGLIAMVFNPCLIFTVLGVLSALGTYGLLFKHPDYRRHLGWKLPATIVVATLGLLISMLAPFWRVLLGALFDLRAPI